MFEGETETLLDPPLLRLDVGNCNAAPGTNKYSEHCRSIDATIADFKVAHQY
jgi:hypothetical protein